ARLSQCGLVDRSQGFDLLPRLTPGQRLVSREGDLWRWDGFVRRAEAPLPAAEKLEQRARRKAIESELVEARIGRDAAHEARAQASRQLTDAEVSAMATRRSAPELTHAAAIAHEAAIRAEQDVERLSLRGAALKESIHRLTAERDHAAAAAEAAKAPLALAPSEPDREALTHLANAVREARNAERSAAAILDAFLRETERAAEQRLALTRDRDDWLARASEADGRLTTIEH